jgi:hypothetical protein
MKSHTITGGGGIPHRACTLLGRCSKLQPAPAGLFRKRLEPSHTLSSRPPGITSNGISIEVLPNKAIT